VHFYRKISYPGADVFEYDPAYQHDEARVSADGSHAMLFDYDGFRLYDIGGGLIKETALPDADSVVDTQYSKQSGNLAVMYKDALRIYSGKDGSPLFEETGLKSVFYAPYGVSVLGADQSLRLIDIDTGAAEKSGMSAYGDFAAYCGMVVDETVLGDKKLIGAGQYKGGYAYAVSDGATGAVYSMGKKLADITVPGDAEVFFAGGAAIVSPLHGTPKAVSLATGRPIADLEKDAYLAYVTDEGDYIATEYLNASNGQPFGLLLDSRTFLPVAHLPLLTDTLGDKLLFDCTGTVRQSPIYSVDELKAMAGELLAK
jgi:hypothetical protein